jgi:hypothetical protein
MIWLAWRRHRLILVVVACVLIALGIWMALVAHAFEVAMRTPAPAGIYPPPGCLGNIAQCNIVFHGWFGAQNQAAFIDLLLFLLPCALGIALGAPLVAGELEHRTNRLAWTQSISRSRWLLVKWVVVGLGAVVLAALVQLVVQWWSGHVFVNFEQSHAIFGWERMPPRLFDVTGIVPIAYTLFAFALGAALGAIFRRTVWAIVGTIVGYGMAALVMVLRIRPALVAPVFNTNGVGFRTVGPGPGAWILGPAARFVPGFPVPPQSPSAIEIVRHCNEAAFGLGTNWSDPFTRYMQCLSIHHVQTGMSYQPASRYWVFQWGEAGIYVAAALVLFGLTLWAVRRWRA